MKSCRSNITLRPAFLCHFDPSLNVRELHIRIWTAARAAFGEEKPGNWVFWLQFMRTLLNHPQVKPRRSLLQINPQPSQLGWPFCFRSTIGTKVGGFHRQAGRQWPSVRFRRRGHAGRLDRRSHARKCAPISAACRSIRVERTRIDKRADPDLRDVARLYPHGPDVNLSAHLYATALRNEAEGSVHD